MPVFVSVEDFDVLVVQLKKKSSCVGSTISNTRNMNKTDKITSQQQEC